MIPFLSLKDVTALHGEMAIFKIDRIKGIQIKRIRKNY